MRYSTSEKAEIIRLVERSHLPVSRTLEHIGVSRPTFYRWYDNYLMDGSDGFEDKPSRPGRVWNRIPDTIRNRVIELALDEPELSPRELAFRFVDTQDYFVSEASVYRALNDMEVLHTLLESAVAAKYLNGEISEMAESLHASAFGDDGSARTFEQFRLEAIQAVEAFGPGNYLAAITSETDFSFDALKREPLTVYIIIDYANKDVLGKFSGLMQWLAAYQLVSVGNNTPVLLVLDEFCNAPCSFCQLS